MSKNISIKEGGTGRGFTARRLETALEGGGSCLWVPKDEVRRVSKSVDKNGTYEAAAEKAYGYSQVHVYVKGGGSATGKGPDGNEYTVTVDDLGELTETKVPSSIMITTPPNYTGPYGDGAIIGFEGIEVTAYDAEGNSMGVVPFNELVFPVTVARYDPDAGGSSIDPSLLYDSSVFSFPFFFLDGGELSYTAGNGTYHYKYKSDGPMVCIRLSDGYYSFYAFSSESGGTVYSKLWTNQQDEPEWTGQEIGLARSTKTGFRYYYNATSEFNFFKDVSGQYINDIGVTGISQNNISDIAQIIFNGTSGGVQIPVQWPRPGDGKILSDTFDITVVDVSPSTDDDESGNGWTL